MNITIFGSGYVGLVTGACLADAGHVVVCIDIDEQKIAKLNKGVIPIYEPGLTDLIIANTQSGNIKFSTDAQMGVTHGELIFIAVGTPPDEDGKADMQYVLEVAKTIGKYLDRYKVVIDKSTVPVGTAERVENVIRNQLSKRNKNYGFDVCSNPEFLKEGSAIDDFVNCARVVIGTESDKVKDLMAKCYLNIAKEKLMFMDTRSAELTKYAANAMLATKISFMNEMANIAELLGADIESIRLGIGSDPRIGYHFINPGCGYGGSCFPKDVQALSRTAQSVNYTPEILLAVESVNKKQKETLFNKLSKVFNGELKNKRIALWGLAFKPNTDDMRDAPSRALMERLWLSGANIQAFDPVADSECRRIYGKRDDLVLTKTKEEALQGADTLVICTDWEEFKEFNTKLFKTTLKYPNVIDGRNIYSPDEMKNNGINYYAVGRGLR